MLRWTVGPHLRCPDPLLPCPARTYEGSYGPTLRYRLDYRSSRPRRAVASRCRNAGASADVEGDCRVSAPDPGCFYTYSTIAVRSPARRASASVEDPLSPLGHRLPDCRVHTPNLSIFAGSPARNPRSIAIRLRRPASRSCRRDQSQRLIGSDLPRIFSSSSSGIGDVPTSARVVLPGIGPIQSPGGKRKRDHEKSCLFNSCIGDGASAICATRRWHRP